MQAPPSRSCRTVRGVSGGGKAVKNVDALSDFISPVSSTSAELGKSGAANKTLDLKTTGGYHAFRVRRLPFNREFLPLKKPCADFETGGQLR